MRVNESEASRKVECPACGYRLNARLHAIFASDSYSCPHCLEREGIEIPMFLVPDRGELVMRSLFDRRTGVDRRIRARPVASDRRTGPRRVLPDRRRSRQSGNQHRMDVMIAETDGEPTGPPPGGDE